MVDLTKTINMRKIVLDSTFVLNTAFADFMKKCDVLCRENKKSMFIPLFEYEIVNNACNSDSLKIQEDAHMGINVISCLEQIGTVKILRRSKGGKPDDYRDFFEKYLSMKYFSVIVDSFEKGKSIVESAKKAGLTQYQIEILKVDQQGNIVYSSNIRTGSRERYQVPEKKEVNAEEIFELSQSFVKMKINKITPVYRIIPGITVFDSNGEAVQIGSKKLVNAESATYETNKAGTWAKIYNYERVSTYYQKKAELMLSRKINYEGLCWPVDMLFDKERNFVGILVPEVKGNPLHLSVFKQAGLQQYFSEWSKVDLCDLAITILKKIRYLHERNIMMGCINPASIFVENPHKVYFADTDCYQIEGYPCFLHNINYTAPELQERQKELYLVSKENEYFGVAVLVFMIMMPGKPPYMGKHPGDASAEIIKMQFPYSNRTIRGVDVPPGVWRFVWSHLTPFKDPFYQTFQKDGKFSLPEKRRETKFWIRITQEFKKELEDKNIYDKESLKMFPLSFKRSGNDVFYRCNYCGVEHPRFFFYDEYFEKYHICKSCINKRSNIYYVCQSCGKTFYYTNKAAIYHQEKEASGEWKKQKYCKDCKDKTAVCRSCNMTFPTFKMKRGMCLECYSKAAYAVITCKNCGRQFTISNGQYEYMISKGLQLPKRCETCRKIRY